MTEFPQYAIYTVDQKMPACLFYCSFYKHWLISIEFDTQYTEELCNTTTVDMSTSPAQCSSGTILANLLCQYGAVKSTSKPEDEIWPMKDFYCCILSWYCRPTNTRNTVIYWCHCRRDIDIFQQDGVRQHIMHARQLSYCRWKLGSSSSRTYGHPIATILILLIIAYEAWCRIMCVSHQFKTMADLRQCLVDTWSDFSQSIVDEQCHWWMA